MRSRDLTPPPSVTGPPGAGPSAAVFGPAGAAVAPALGAVLGVVGALLALSHLSVGGFLVFGALATAFGYVATVQWRQARAPRVLVGPGGVWLAGTDREPGRAIAWAEVAELVFCTVTERRVFEQRSVARPCPALGVRLASPPALDERDREGLQLVLPALAPGLRDTVHASMTAFVAMPYRSVARSAASRARALEEVVHRYAPYVTVVEGPPVVFDLAWRPGSDTTLPPGLLGEALRSPLERLGVVERTDTRS
jgi:hypothetical protein